MKIGLPKNKVSHFYISFMPALFFLSLTWTVIDNFNFKPVLFSFLLFYGITVIKAIFYYGFLSIYCIYLYTSVFFVYSRLVFDLIGYDSFLNIKWPVNYVFSDKVGVCFMCSIFLSHYILDIVYTYTCCKIHLEESNNKLKYFPAMQKSGAFLMIVFLPAVVYKTYRVFVFAKANGYISLYNGQAADMELPFWTKGSVVLFTVWYLIVLSSYPPRKVFVKVTLLYFVGLVMASLSGGRSGIITGIILMVYLYSRFYGKNLSTKTLVIVLSCIIALSVGLGISRAGQKVSGINPVKILTNFLYEQGSTIAVPLVIIEADGNLKYRNYPFILTPAFGFISKILYPTPNQHTQVYLEKYNSMGSITMNKLSSGTFRWGAGLGGSFIAEMYDCGGFFGIIFWSAILALLMIFVEKNLMLHNLTIPLYWYLTGSIVMLPRSSFLGIFNNLLYFIFIALFIKSINFIFYPKKINTEARERHNWKMAV